MLQGLWLWSSPIKRTAADGSTYHLLLLDTEGIDAADQVCTLTNLLCFGRNPADALRPADRCDVAPRRTQPQHVANMAFVSTASATELAAVFEGTLIPTSVSQTGEYSTKIFSLAVLLSSLFVYNQMGGIDEASLDRLSLVTEVRPLPAVERLLSLIRLLLPGAVCQGPCGALQPAANAEHVCFVAGHEAHPCPVSRLDRGERSRSGGIHALVPMAAPRLLPWCDPAYTAAPYERSMLWATCRPEMAEQQLPR